MSFRVKESTAIAIKDVACCDSFVGEGHVHNGGEIHNWIAQQPDR